MGRFSQRMLVAAAVAASALAFNAEASDIKVYPGAQCQLESSSNYWDGTPSVFNMWGAAFTNLHTYWDHVICPITRDRTTGTRGIPSVVVRIYNPGTGRGFTCDLWSLAKFASAGTVSGFPAFEVPLQTFTAAAASTGLVELTLNVNVSEVSGYYALHCEVPPQGHIYSYEVKE
jgi:hypothetical protein